jgi:methylisocitrate lyase
VVDVDTACQRIRAATDARRDENFVIIARTDARAIEGLDSAIARAQAMVDAGADMVFAEAMESLDEFEKMCRALRVPVLANMTEFGKSELFTRDQLESVGVKVIIYPVSLLRLAMGAADRALATLSAEGSLSAEVPSMQTRVDLYDLLDYEGYSRFDADIYSFGKRLASPDNQ